VECFAALPRVRTMSEFKPVRNIALVSSHDLQVALSRPRPHHRSLGQPTEATTQNTVFGRRVADSGQIVATLAAASRRRGVRDSLNEPC
jgi:hypothetical protein